MWKRNFTSLEVLTEKVRKRNLRYLEILAERSAESGTSDICQSRQIRSAEAELQIFGSQRRTEVRKELHIFSSQDRAETELQIFGSQGRAEVGNWNFKSSAVKTKRKCESRI